MADAEFEVTIPGLKDFFKWGVNKTSLPETVRARIQRMKDAKSPVPKPLKWIPHVITEIDNAQDIAYTAAFLARPLLRKAPAKAIPYIGWGLRAMDIANLIVMVLGLAMTPGIKKPDLAGSLKRIRRKLKDPNFAFKTFVGKPGWRGYLGFVLQGAQACETLTGKGLQLGKLMGALSDTTWGLYRYVWEGKKTKIKLPKSNDPVAKACNFLSNAWDLINAKDILSTEDHQLIIAAQSLAHGIIQDAAIAPVDGRLDEMIDRPTLGEEPWEDVSRQVLTEEGFDLDGDIRPFHGDPDAPPITQGEAMKYSMEEYLAYSENLYNIMGTSENTYVWYMIHKEAGENCLQNLTGVTPDQYSMYDDSDIDALHLALCNARLENVADTQAILAWYAKAKDFAAVRQHNTVQCDDWLSAAQYLNMPIVPKDEEAPPEPPPPPPEPPRVCPQPEPTQSRIGGIITDSATGQPLDAALVVIQAISFWDRSNFEGIYCTVDLRPGVYTLRFSKPGYVLQTHSITTYADQLTNFDVELQQLE